MKTPRGRGNIRRIALVSKLTGYFDLGDIVMSNAVVSCVRRQFPAASIVLLARADEIDRYRERFYTRHSWVDEFHVCPLLSERSWIKWLGLYLRMRALRIDLCITNIDSLPAWLVFLTGIPLRMGVQPRRSRFARLLTHPVAVNMSCASALHWTDVASAYMTVLSGTAGCKVSDVVPYVRYEKEPEVVSASWRRPIVAMHIGGAMHWNRRWPKQSYLEVCVRLTRQFGATVAFVCGEEERAEVAWLTARLQRLCPHARVASFAGCSINRVLNVYAAADLFVGNDSGLMHLAVAMGLPTVAVFGPSNHSYLGADRVDARHRVFTRNFPCARGGCQLGCKPRYDMDAPDYPACMKGIDVTRVWDAIATQLSTNARADMSAMERG